MGKRLGYALPEVDFWGRVMQVEKWGNSLAVRLPAALVEALQLKEGDEIEVELAGNHTFRIGRDRTCEGALARLRALAWTPPPGFRFSRDEANERGE